MRMHKSVIGLVGVAGMLAAISPALGATGRAHRAPSFSKPVVLKGYGGGEPSLALDPNRPNYVYVTAPQGIPSVAGSALGISSPNGIGFWASHDGGRTFPVKANIGSDIGGGDSDVVVGSNGTVYVADLEAAGASICTSHDHGRSWTSGNALSAADKCNGVTTNQQGPENDRQWLNVSHGQSDAV